VWAYLNWAHALRSAGCEVLWLESGREREGTGLSEAVAALRDVLAPHGFDDRLIIDTDESLPEDSGAAPLEAAADADLLVDLAYMPPDVVSCFRRTALIDIDPGLTQLWWSAGDLDLDAYDTYFTVGQGVAAGTATVPDCGVRWRYAPPCADLDAWPACPLPPAGSAWTTVSHWWWDEDFENSKKVGFEPLLNLPSRVQAPLELALGGLDDDDEHSMLERHGWRVADADQVAPNVDEYRRYIQQSRGEFSAAKPLYVSCGTGWLSDRTICYLASGRPAVVQDTSGGGLSAGEGLLTFTDAEHAATLLRQVERAYEQHCLAARALAEERYAGPVVAARVLAEALA
jgi:hypothetical protein